MLEFFAATEAANTDASLRRHHARHAQSRTDEDGGFVPTREKVGDPIGRTIKDAIRASCTIFVRTEGGQWEGSGFHLGGGLIATAGHVVPAELAHGGQITVTFDGTNALSAQFSASEPAFDSGIIYCPDAEHAVPGVLLADSNAVQLGDIIAVLGSPQGFHDTATVGRVANMHQSINDPSNPAWSDFIIITAEIAEGASGGMCIGTDGLVIGSVVGVTGEHASTGVGQRVVCPSNKIRTLLQRLA